MLPGKLQNLFFNIRTKLLHTKQFLHALECLKQKILWQRVCSCKLDELDIGVVFQIFFRISIADSRRDHCLLGISAFHTIPFICRKIFSDFNIPLLDHRMIHVR